MNILELEQITSDLVKQGNIEDAISTSLKACNNEPENELLWLSLSKIYYQTHDIKNAFESCNKALSLNPDSEEINYNIALLFYASENYDRAISICKSVLKNNPKFIDAMALLGSALSYKSQFKEAEKHLSKCIQLEKNNGEFYVHLADVQLISGDIKNAIKNYTHAQKILGDRTDILSALSDAHERFGQHDKAAEIISTLFEKETDSFNVAISFSKLCKLMNRTPEAIERLLKLSTSENSRDDKKRKIHFSLGKLYDNQKEYKLAFKHYKIGNQLKHAQFDTAQDARTADAIINAFSSQSLSQFQTAKKGSKKDIRPIFIVGLPRSGTSLVEQILASHPNVYAGGELPGIFDIVSDLQNKKYSDLTYPACLKNLTADKLNKISKEYIKKIKPLTNESTKILTDKTPLNYYHLGLIQLLFPKARIINCARNPADTCLSCYFQDFYSHQPFSYDLKNLSEFYKNYLKLMSHWKRTLKLPIFDISYEALVTQPESEIKSLIDFTGLKWHDQCLDFHKNKRHVATASYDQVRQPMYTSSTSRWKSYKENIDDLLKSLNIQ